MYNTIGKIIEGCHLDTSLFRKSGVLASAERRFFHERLVKENIEYDHLVDVVEKLLLDELVDIIVETVCTQRKEQRKRLCAGYDGRRQVVLL